MYLPPAAAWTVDSAPWQRRALVALGLLGTLAGLFFCLQQSWGAVPLLLLFLPGACALGACLGLSKAAKGQLRWDGERWHWSDAQDHAVTRLACVLDLQRFMLVRIDCEAGRSQWLWLHSPSMESRWLGLRRAVVASQQGRVSAQTDSLPE